MKNRFEIFNNYINDIYRTIQKIKHKELQKYNLKGTHFMCFYCLAKHKKGLTFKEICEYCIEDKALISRNLKFLKLNGYVKIKDEDTNMKYKNSYVLTEKGFELFKVLNKKLKNIELKVKLDNVKEEDLKALYNHLDVILENLKKI